MWILLAFGSALFAGLSSVLAKCGIKKTPSEVATAIRTAIVLCMAFLMTVIVGSLGDFCKISPKSWIFLVLSGISTGVSWLCFFKALELADVNKVVPVDKTSTVLTLIFAMIFFREAVNVWKIVSVLAICVGTFLMIERKGSVESRSGKGWFLFACLSAVFASLTSIWGKVGINGVESNLGTLIRTFIVLLMSFLVVTLTKKGNGIFRRNGISRRDLLFIVLSGLATGASWLCYYRALKDGVTTVVVSVDKLSMLVTVGFSVFVLKEKLSVKGLIGLLLIVSGTIALIFC
ncbi:MAG: EamA family transporter [Candidatus Borkfalkiaceae bacterium]|nr:EamA family transporter [Christensenellaceae bacterium]